MASDDRFGKLSPKFPEAEVTADLHLHRKFVASCAAR
jgi:hypothetical protein